MQSSTLDSPVHVLETGLLRARHTAEQHDDRVGLGRNEPKQEHVLAATVVTLQHSLSEGAVSVETHLFALGADKVVDDMTAEGRRDTYFLL